MLRKIISLVVLLTGFSTLASAQSFEGIIEFKKLTGKTTVNYVYYVKGDKIRIDEFSNGTRTVEGSFILDTKANTMLYLNHARKLWGTREPKGTSAAPAGAVVSATKDVKELFGYKCTEQIVKSEKDSTSVTYYVATGKFTFFTPMMKMLNRQENFATYFLAVPVKEGAMPLLAIEKDLNGVEKGRLEVTRLEGKQLTESLFEVPKEYTGVK